MIKTLEFKLYPNKKTITTLEYYLEVCKRLYNEALDHRIKHYNKDKKQISLYDQFKLLTELRNKNEYFKNVPVEFERDPLRRVDNAFKDFFRRLESKKGKAGFPRYKNSSSSYKSMQFLLSRNNYIRLGFIHVPGIGKISSRKIKDVPEGKQKFLRIIKRASGWYAQVFIDKLIKQSKGKQINKAIGIDLGLTNFIATSAGKIIKNPKFLIQREDLIKFLQRKLSKKIKGSSRYKKLNNKIAKLHEKIANQRRNFCHQISTDLVKNNDLIVIEDLKIENMIKYGNLSKSTNDACWGNLKQQLKYKAENAGTILVLVDPKYTSQTCPDCGEIVKKELNERTHSCKCGCVLDRDVAAAKVILKIGLQVLGIAETKSSPRDEANKSSLVEVSSSSE